MPKKKEVTNSYRVECVNIFKVWSYWDVKAGSAKQAAFDLVASGKLEEANASLTVVQDEEYGREYLIFNGVVYERSEEQADA